VDRITFRFAGNKRSGVIAYFPILVLTVEKDATNLNLLKLSAVISGHVGGSSGKN
jgi:hypothetical protein